MTCSSIDSARELRENLNAQISRLSRRSRAADLHADELGLPRDSDRVLDLRRRLAQVESFLHVADDGLISIEAAWFSPEEAGPANGRSVS